MRPRPEDLPDYGRPPLREVALGVLFEPLPLKQAHLGLYWAEIRDAFPRLQDLPPLDSPVEGIQPGEGPVFRFERLDSMPVQRSWFIGPDDSTLVQVQADRFVHNWRGEGVAYPRYERLRESFEQRLRQFSDLCHREGFGPLTIRQCDVDYVNHVPALGLEEMLVGVGNHHLHVPSIDSAPVESRIAMRYNVQQADQVAARLYVEAHPVDPSHYMLNISVKWPLKGTTISEVLPVMDESRDLIVRAFTDLTTPAMHERWERLK